MSTYEVTATVLAIFALLVSVAGLFGLVLSIVALRKQVEVMNDQAAKQHVALKQSAESSLDPGFVLATQAYLDHPDLRALFNENEDRGNVPALDREMSLRACALAEHLADFMERSLKPQISEGSTTLRIWIDDSFRHSTFLCSWLEEHRHWYDDELLNILDAVRREEASTEDAA